MLIYSKRQFFIENVFYKNRGIIMDDKKERNLTIIEKTEEAEAKPVKKEVSHHTNPIMKKLMTFHHEKASKLSVKDLFKK